MTAGNDNRSMRERMLAGEPYLAGDPEIAEAGARALDLVAAYNATSVRAATRRRRLLEELLGAIGEGTEIRPPFYVDYGSNIRVGARCFARRACSIISIWCCPATACRKRNRIPCLCCMHANASASQRRRCF